MQPNAQQVGPAAGPINLEKFQESVNKALEESVPCMLITADASGHPDVALKGSMMVFDNDHMAWWERSRAEQAAQVAENPHVAIWYRNPETRVQLRFYGEAEIHENDDIRQQIMDKTVQRELDADPERKGFGVLVRIDRVRLSRNTVQERNG
ncbi:MAG: uncharacterized protein QOF51_2170 [Chloroflexota bacterium]|jgi:general stress protein 26|nr:uncharacterized protein [Chloroflexota bacterium]